MHIYAHIETFSCQSQGSGHPIAFTCHRMTSIDAVLTVSSIADMSQVRLPAERDVVLATGRAQLTMIKNTNTRTPFASIMRLCYILVLFVLCSLPAWSFQHYWAVRNMFFNTLKLSLTHLGSTCSLPPGPVGNLASFGALCNWAVACFSTRPNKSPIGSLVDLGWPFCELVELSLLQGPKDPVGDLPALYLSLIIYCHSLLLPEWPTVVSPRFLSHLKTFPA